MEIFLTIVFFAFGILFAVPLFGLFVWGVVGVCHLVVDEISKKGEEYIMNNNGGVPRQFTRPSLEFKVMYVVCLIIGSIALGLGYIFYKAYSG